MKEIREIVHLFECCREESFALATLVAARGSSYRRPGARMLISSTGKIAGSISGGCLEDEVALRALEVMRTGESAWMAFDTRRRFGCNGALEILIERAAPDFLRELASAFHARKSCCIGIDTAVGRSAVFPTEDLCSTDIRQTIEPSIHLVLMGDGPDSAAFRGLAQSLGWSVELLESAAELRAEYGPWTAFVIKTHNYGRDCAALRSLLPLNPRYVGLLGPRSRREQLLGDLLDTGIVPGPNLYAPAGLDLGGSAPETIALSIVAEIHSVFSAGSARPLRESKRPIHAPRVAGTDEDLQPTAAPSV